MITTYSYLDQYKQIGLGTPIDYFSDITIAVTPFPLDITITESMEYGIVISQSNEYGISL